MKKVVVITGASSGIGFALAKEFLNRNYIVYSFSRSKPKDENIKFVPCDVSDAQMLKEAFSKVNLEEKHIDILINNAGMGISGAMEYTSQEDIQKIVNINFLGVVNSCVAGLPYLRESKGTIVNISSLGAEYTIAFQAMYSATKAAVTAFSTALKNEVRPYGVRVVCVLPGDVKTSFTKNRVKKEHTETIYSDREKRSVEYMEKCEQNGIPADKIANKICKVTLRKNPPVTFTIGIPYKLTRFLYRVFPQKLINYILYSLYGK